jgi:hypothetical protein
MEQDSIQTHNMSLKDHAVAGGFAKYIAHEDEDDGSVHLEVPPAYGFCKTCLGLEAFRIWLRPCSSGFTQVIAPSLMQLNNPSLRQDAMEAVMSLNWDLPMVRWLLDSEDSELRAQVEIVSPTGLTTHELRLGILAVHHLVPWGWLVAVHACATGDMPEVIKSQIASLVEPATLQSEIQKASVKLISGIPIGD